MIKAKITAGTSTLYETELPETYNNRADYLGELKRLADSEVSSGIEVVLWLKFPKAKCYAIYNYVTGTDEAVYMGGVE